MTVFKFFQNFAEIFASQFAPLVSTTPAANFSTSFASVVDIGGKFATSVNDTGGKFATGVNDTGGKHWNNYQTADNLKRT
jgi:hypothetical protein